MSEKHASIAICKVRALLGKPKVGKTLTSVSEWDPEMVTQSIEEIGAAPMFSGPCFRTTFLAPADPCLLFVP